MKIDEVIQEEAGFWSARIGSIWADGRTKSEAIAACKQMVKQVINHDAEPTRTMITPNRTFVFVDTPYGIDVTSFMPDGLRVCSEMCSGTMDKVYSDYQKRAELLMRRDHHES